MAKALQHTVACHHPYSLSITIRSYVLLRLLRIKEDKTCSSRSLEVHAVSE